MGAKVEQEQKDHLSGFADDLKSATTGLYEKLAADKTAQANVIAGMTSALDTAKAASAAELKEAKELFASRELSLVNAITANQHWFKNKLAEKTQMVLDWKKASDDDREAIRAVRNSMKMDLEAGIEEAIAIGKAKAVQERAIENIDIEKKTLLTTISVAVEAMADNVFASVQGNRQKIADNYLSLKAYAQAAADSIADYVT